MQVLDNVIISLFSILLIFINLVIVGPGERLAKMELAVMLGSTLHQFRIELSDPNVQLKAAAKLLLSPSDEIPATIRFIPRV